MTRIRNGVTQHLHDATLRKRNTCCREVCHHRCGVRSPVTKAPERNRGYLLSDGESVTWNAVSPTDEPAAVAVMCVSDAERKLSEIEYNIGVDKQVVADQINDILGPLGSVDTGSISGGSVGLGAGAFGSLVGDADGADGAEQ